MFADAVALQSELNPRQVNELHVFAKVSYFPLPRHHVLYSFWGVDQCQFVPRYHVQVPTLAAG